jgi:hypothetical protein
MKRLGIKLIGILLSFTACVEEPVTFPNTWKGNYEALWHIVDTRYCFLDYKRINWDSIHSAYAVRMDTVQSEYALFEVLAEMLDELKDGHVNLSSSFNRSRYWNWFQDYPSNFAGNLIFSQRYLGFDYRIAGGLRYKTIHNGKIGYVYYESFSNAFSEENVKELFLYFSQCDGLIVDVRNNGGGTLTLAENFASGFFDQKTLTGYVCHKIGEGHSDFSTPMPIYTNRNASFHWDKKVVVLSNRMSYSATNMFICRMKQAPRAKILGDHSGGGGGLPMSNELPIGWSVRYSASPFMDAEKNQIEWGIDPDVFVSLVDADVQNGYDTLIESAIDLLYDTNW